MQISSRLLFKTAIVLLGLVLLVSLVVVSSSTRQANALSGSDWTVVRTAVNAYFTGAQSGGGNDGEAGYVMTQADLKGRIDSDGDGQAAPTTNYLDEGDDAANAPVLVDNLVGTANVIPGTSVRCNWNTAAATISSCMNANRVDEVKERVDAHQAAGFSTDVAVYCATGRTESPTTTGFGAIGNTSGGLATDTGLTPDVYAFTWGRNGWTNTSTFATTYTRDTGTVAAPSTTYSVTNSALPDCSAESTDAGRVRCAAAWAIDSAGGNVSNGVNPSTSGDTFASPNLGPVIDVNDPSPVNTIVPSTNPATLQIQYDTVFNTNLQYIGVGTATTKNVVASRTSHLGGGVAMGLRMLGYNATFLREGMSGWNANYPGGWASTGVAYSTIAATGGNVDSGIDQTLPTQSGINTVSTTSTSAVIERDASEAASMKVQYGTTMGGPYTSTENDTVLNQTNKQVTLSGLTPGDTYYYVVTSYDGQANASTTSAEYSFTTPCTAGQPTLSLLAPSPFWASGADFLARDLSVNWTVQNNGTDAAYSVKITGSTPANVLVTLLTGLPANIGTIAGSGGTGSATLKYDVPISVGSFWVTNTGSAKDECGTTFTYP